MPETLFPDLSKRDKTILAALNGIAPNLFFIDGHKHDFRAASGTPNCVILRFLLRPAVSKIAASFLAILNPFTDKDLGNRLANYLSRSNQPSWKILSDWRDLFKSHCREENSVAGASLAIDMEIPFQRLVHGKKQKTLYGFRDQLTEIIALARKPENLGRVLPFVGIDPRQEDLFDLLSSAFENGCIGGKVYPSLGFLPSHPRLMRVWKTFEELGIPVVTHCSDIGIFSFETILPMQGKLYNPKSKTTREVNENWRFWLWGCKIFRQVRPWIYLNDPIHWRPVLEEFPNLKLCFAHVGGKKEIENHMKGRPSWTATILGYINNEKYLQVYTDLSFVSRYRSINQYFLNLAKSDARFRERLILGTDFPLDELLTDAQSAVDGMLEDFEGFLPIFGVNNFLRFIN